MTANPRITRDAVAFFKNMAIGKLDGKYRNLLVAPVSLKTTLLSLIEKETAKGEKGRIIVKINAVTDEEIIAALKEASCAGVQITMLIRGISCIIPGIEGKTENIEIRSVVGRYLEHSRVYIFGTGAQEKMYISSADFMTRNTERRVEIAAPVLNAEHRKKIHEYIDIYLKDNTKARRLMPNGRYHKIPHEGDDVIAQEELMKNAAGSPQTIKSTSRKAARAFATEYKAGKK
jgi:polyphosphate kinase